MASFQVFIPDSPEQKTVPLASVGLIDGFRGHETDRTQSGPDGKPGAVYSWITPQAVRFGYKPDQQTWIPSAKNGDQESGAYWVGFWNDSPPTEKDLRRPDMRRGALIELGNKERWTITTPDHLDRFPDLQSDGSIRWCSDTQFNWLTADLDRRKEEGIQTSEVDGESVTSILFDDEHDWYFLCRVLAVNYRITPEVVSQLRLFSQSAIRETVAALMGMVLRGDS
jgi:hypothetical protein